jgi:hypothetical protein
MRASLVSLSVLAGFFHLSLLPRFSFSADETRSSGEPLALIVHPKNTVEDLSNEEVHAFFTLQKQFWPSGKRVVLFLRASSSPAQKVLLENVYKMAHEELRKYWVGKVFAGEIPAIPTVMRTAAAASAAVGKLEGAISIVRLSEVPEGVKIVTIDGKKPGDPEYSLVEKKDE